MQSIYNENLVPIHPDYQELEDQLHPILRNLLQTAQKKDLNLREVAHEFSKVLFNLESELILLKAAEKYQC